MRGYLHTLGENEPSAHYNEEIMRKECGWTLHYDGNFQGAPDFWVKSAQGDFVDFDALSRHLVGPGATPTSSGGQYTNLKSAIDKWIASLTTNTAKRNYSPA